MLEWVIIGGLVGVFLALREKAKGEIADKERELVRELQNLEKTFKREKELLRTRISEAKRKINFKACIDAHYSSFTTADLAMKIIKREKEVSRTLRNRLDQISRNIEIVKQDLNTLPRSPEREGKYQSLKTAISLHKSMLADIRILSQKKDTLYEELNQLNHQTHELKLLIRDNFGQRGRDWFSKR
jgi:hypothetical protein